MLNCVLGKQNTELYPWQANTELCPLQTFPLRSLPSEGAVWLQIWSSMGAESCDTGAGKSMSCYIQVWIWYFLCRIVCKGLVHLLFGLLSSHVICHSGCSLHTCPCLLQGPLSLGYLSSLHVCRTLRVHLIVCRLVPDYVERGANLLTYVRFPVIVHMLYSHWIACVPLLDRIYV